MARAVKKNDGKSLESCFQAAAKAWCSANRGFFHRFTDTHAAGNLVQPQPGDFLLCLYGAALLVECKSTSKGSPLKRLLTSETAKKQLGKHRLWQRSYSPSGYLWADVTTGEAHWYDGADVIRAMDDKGKAVALWTGKLEQMDHLLDFLRETYSQVRPNEQTFNGCGSAWPQHPHSSRQ